MGPLDALIHLVNFFLPALGMALLAPTLARLAFWKTLRGQWWTQARGVALVGAGVLLAGLLLTGRDGAMVTYGGLVLSSALVIWWTGLR
ncbi:hypothetical protein DEH84_02890 [Aquabacterium olei]|uniref:Uncharacterized protein n=1 Tax=Aquabacterium olei TaxID=1296669 RepID=A0A2U8FQ96_9BURK|nr:hypothetical protein [Aquabacterium olei]AWI52486.1 hypothetical protein DEH84_02890 [Aquabacterium olei]